MAGANAVVRARIDEATRDEAAAVLGEMGLSVSDAIRMLLIRVARDHTIPFDLKVPNAETRAAMLRARARMKTGEGFGPAEDMLDELEAGASGKKGKSAA